MLVELLDAKTPDTKAQEEVTNQADSKEPKGVATLCKYLIHICT